MGTVKHVTDPSSGFRYHLSPNPHDPFNIFRVTHTLAIVGGTNLHEALFPGSFHNYSFRDSDGVRYIHTMFSCTTIGGVLSPSVMIEIAKIIDPEHTYAIATDEHRALLAFYRHLVRLRDETEHLFMITQYLSPDTSPEDSDRFASASRAAAEPQRWLLEFGLSHQQIDLALQLMSRFPSQPRELLRAVLVVDPGSALAVPELRDSL